MLSDPLPRRRVWVDAFAIGRFPVTNRRYADWLDALVREGREDEVARRVPRLPSGIPAFPRGPDGRHQLSDARFLRPACPVVRVGWDDAAAWCAAHGRRLPVDGEWEKAARGVDERVYPWGDAVAPGQAALRGTDGTWDVGAFPADVSPYGMRDASGNVSDWVADAVGSVPLDGDRVIAPLPRLDEPTHYIRGGMWNFGSYFGRVDLRRSYDRGADGVGFRACRSWPPRPAATGR